MMMVMMMMMMTHLCSAARARLRYFNIIV